MKSNYAMFLFMLQVTLPVNRTFDQTADISVSRPEN